MKKKMTWLLPQKSLVVYIWPQSVFFTGGVRLLFKYRADVSQSIRNDSLADFESHMSQAAQQEDDGFLRDRRHRFCRPVHQIVSGKGVKKD